ncbi:hypothetical protein ACFSTC_27030 [Nonomuraea ferruginea]
MPELAPVSWVLQTLAVFFLVGGLVNGRRRGPYGAWLKARTARLFRPVGALAGGVGGGRGRDVRVRGRAGDGAHAGHAGGVAALVPAGVRAAHRRHAAGVAAAPGVAARRRRLRRPRPVRAGRAFLGGLGERGGLAGWCRTAWA